MNEAASSAKVWSRLVLVCLGGTAALALWKLGELGSGGALAPALFLALFCLVLAYGTVALALVGPIPTGRALIGAMLLALPVAGLASLAGLRHPDASDLLDDPVTCGTLAGITLIALPFLQVWLQDRRTWLRYDALFDAAWTISLRYGLALIFAGLFWMVIFLSNALLGLVEITLIEVLLRTEWATFMLTGAVLGLGLAVVFELHDTVSPYLILRLLRLFVPVVLPVVALFLMAVPFRGLSDLFGEFSAAGILMGASVASITLISTALDTADGRAVSTRGLRAATRLLALLLPLLGVLAVWAVVLRVHQYGWTPDRVMATCLALVLLVYALAYGGAVLSGASWMRLIRAANVVMALVLLALGSLWMTPVLNAYFISATSQSVRFADGRISIDQLPVWEMAHDWGRPGLDALERLEMRTDLPDHAALLARLDSARRADNRYLYIQALARRDVPEQAARLARILPLRPKVDPLGATAFAALPPFRLTEWLAGCERRLADGRPGCVLVRGAFAPLDTSSDQGVLLYLSSPEHVRANHLTFKDGQVVSVREVYDPRSDRWPDLTPDLVERALDGAFRIAPSGGLALWISDLVLQPTGQ